MAVRDTSASAARALLNAVRASTVPRRRLPNLFSLTPQELIGSRSTIRGRPRPAQLPRRARHPGRKHLNASRYTPAASHAQYQELRRRLRVVQRRSWRSGVRATKSHHRGLRDALLQRHSRTAAASRHRVFPHLGRRTAQAVAYLADKIARHHLADVQSTGARSRMIRTSGGAPHKGGGDSGACAAAALPSLVRAQDRGRGPRRTGISSGTCRIHRTLSEPAGR